MQGSGDMNDNPSSLYGPLAGVLAGATALLSTLIPRLDAWFKERRAAKTEETARELQVDESMRASFTLLLQTSRSEVEAYKREVTQLREENTQLREESYKLHEESRKLHERIDDLESKVRELQALSKPH